MASQVPAATSSREEGLRTAATRGWRRGRWWREVVLLGGWNAAYEGVRAASPTRADAARAHAWGVLAAERWAHLNPEAGLNRLLSSSPWLSVLAGYYYAILHFAVTPLVLIWLYRRHGALYRRARTVLVAASSSCLLVFWFYPVAPPRLVLGGLDDTVVTHNVLGAAHAASSGMFVDLYAALPSLHVGWAFWAAASVIRTRPRNPLSHLVWLYPATTALVVLATANHYLVDAAAGVAAIGLTGLAVRLIGSRPPDRRPVAG